MGITSEPLPASVRAAGLDLARLLARWSKSEAPVWAALLPLDPAQEAGEALAVSGAAFLVLADASGWAALFSDRPFPAGVRRWIEAHGRTRTAAFAREMPAESAALAALTLFDGPAPLAFAGGAWAGFTTTTEDTSMEHITKADLFNRPRPKPVRVEIPELDRVVHVRVLSAAEVEDLQGTMFKLDDGEASFDLRGQRGRLVALCACDEAGVRIFVDDDAAEIGRLPACFVDPIFEAAQSANGMTAKAKDRARKN
jgi:hypothetical protein